MPLSGDGTCFDDEGGCGTDFIGCERMKRFQRDCGRKRGLDVDYWEHLARKSTLF